MEDLALGQATLVANPQDLGISKIFAQIDDSKDLDSHIGGFRSIVEGSHENAIHDIGQSVDTQLIPPIFGESLHRLLSREQSNIPRLVQICVEIIDTHGLTSEVSSYDLRRVKAYHPGLVPAFCSTGRYEQVSTNATKS